VSLLWRVTSEQISLSKFHSQFVANLTKWHFHLISQKKVAAPKKIVTRKSSSQVSCLRPDKTAADARYKKHGEYVSHLLMTPVKLLWHVKR
jgi:hypothetical protein